MCHTSSLKNKLTKFCISPYANTPRNLTLSYCNNMVLNEQFVDRSYDMRGLAVSIDHCSVPYYSPSPLPSVFATFVSRSPRPRIQLPLRRLPPLSALGRFGVFGGKAHDGNARMTPFAFLQQLYSLDTLDTRFTTSAQPPQKAANGDSAQAVKPQDEKLPARLPPGASPSRWRTPEFYFYALVHIVVVPLMFKAVVDVSQREYGLCQNPKSSLSLFRC